MWGLPILYWRDVSLYRSYSTPRLPWRTALTYAWRLSSLRRRYGLSTFRPVKLGEFAEQFLEFVIEKRDMEGFSRTLVTQATGMSEDQWNAMPSDQGELYLGVRDCSPEIVRPRSTSTQFQIDETTIPRTDLANWALAEQIRDIAKGQLQECGSENRLSGIIVTANPDSTATRLGKGGLTPATATPLQVIPSNNRADVALVRYQHAPSLAGKGERIVSDYILITLPESRVNRTAALAVIKKAFRYELLQPIVVRCRHHYGFDRVVEGVQRNLLAQGIPRETSAACCAIIHELAVGMLLAKAWPHKHLDETLTVFLRQAPQRKDSLRQVAFTALLETTIQRQGGRSLPGSSLELISRILGVEKAPLEETLRGFADSFLKLDPFNLELEKIEPCVFILARRCPKLLAALSWESLATCPPEPHAGTDWGE